WNPPFCVLDCIFSIGLPWLFVYQKMVPMKSRWLPSTPNIIEPNFLKVQEEECHLHNTKHIKTPA
ncbi:hypothetical protein, partial [Aerococcus mictus]|uniref:hypothetical protein n=1 Tax=Aerococcus mictus TaxID=2976810 RepID=UPI001CD5368A